MYNGILLAHVSHYLSVVFMWSIVRALLPDGRTLPLLAAMLHVVAPAGIFLSSPYTESLFSCLSMLGFWLYLKSRLSISATSRGFKLLAGMSLGLATSVRSNGVLAGILFLSDLLDCGREMLHGRAISSSIAQAVTIVASGLCIVAGFAVPQISAYHEYCGAPNRSRPWCDSLVPSIYSFVQAHYWYGKKTHSVINEANVSRNVGFLKYWTLSNIPLFILATPCLFLMIISSLDLLSPFATTYSGRSKSFHRPEAQRLAVVQLVLACLAITNYHVQIITRVSSAYPWTYIWLAEQVGRSKYGRPGVVIFVLYAMVQAGLYASFLPPA